MDLLHSSLARTDQAIRLPSVELRIRKDLTGRMDIERHLLGDSFSGVGTKRISPMTRSKAQERQ
jgi:hypothetical protein